MQLFHSLQQPILAKEAPYHRVTSVILMASLIVGLFVFYSSYAQAAPDTPAEYFDNIMVRFQRTCESWQGTMMSAAIAIFWPLALISLTWKMIQTWAMGTDLKGVFQELFWPGFFIALYYFLLTNGSVIGGAILDTFVQLGETATGAGRGTFVSPTAVMNVGWRIWAEIWEVAWENMGMSPSSWLMVFFLAAVALGTLFIITTIAVDLLIALLSGWVMLYGGLVVLAFGGAFGFGLSDKAKNYFMTMITVGMRIMALGLLIGVFVDVIGDQLTFMENQIHTQGSINLEEGLTILIVAIAFKLACSQIPELLVGMINGHVGQLGARGEAIVGGVAAGAMAIGGAGMAATKAAAGGIANGVNSVMRAQAQSQLNQVQGAANVRQLAERGVKDATRDPNVKPKDIPAASDASVLGTQPPASLHDSIQQQAAASSPDAAKLSAENAARNGGVAPNPDSNYAGDLLKQAGGAGGAAGGALASGGAGSPSFGAQGAKADAAFAAFHAKAEQVGANAGAGAAGGSRGAGGAGTRVGANPAAGITSAAMANNAIGGAGVGSAGGVMPPPAAPSGNSAAYGGNAIDSGSGMGSQTDTSGTTDVQKSEQQDSISNSNKNINKFSSPSSEALKAQGEALQKKIDGIDAKMSKTTTNNQASRTKMWANIAAFTRLATGAR